MSEVVGTTGSDTGVRDDFPNRPNEGADQIRLEADHRVGLIHQAVTDIRGRIVSSATLRGHVKDGFAPQTVTVTAAMSPWSAGSATWNTQPTGGASADTVIASSHDDGDAVDLDITVLIQFVANGTDWRGMILSTDADLGESDWYSFDSGKDAWVLTIELSDVPEQPSNLRPSAGLAVGAAAPIVAWSYTDLGGDSSDQGAFKVQADVDADEGSPAFDSGWITSSDPQYDLSSGAFDPLSAGDPMQWRVQTRDVGGDESPWSDWVAFTYEPYPTLTMDSPTGGTIQDSTFQIEAHLTGETLTQWRAWVLDVHKNVRWDSLLHDDAIAITVPKRNDDEERVLVGDDFTYYVKTRAWGDVARATAVGLPKYVEVLTAFTFDDDGGVTAPTSLTVVPATPGDPRLLFTWHRTDDPDGGWQILRDHDIVERLDPDEVTNVAGTYTWTDQGLSRPYTSHTWTVRAVDGGNRSHASNAVSVTLKPGAVWLVPEASTGLDPIRMDGIVSLDTFARNDRRVSYAPINSGTNLDIIYEPEGVSGSFVGTISDKPGQDRQVLGAGHLVDRIRQLSQIPSSRPRLVWASESRRVMVWNLDALPASTFDDVSRRHNVGFAFIEKGD